VAESVGGGGEGRSDGIPGDPKCAADSIVKMVEAEKKPPRIILGNVLFPVLEQIAEMPACDVTPVTDALDLMECSVILII
jgi:hypothetical protein